MTSRAEPSGAGLTFKAAPNSYEGSYENTPQRPKCDMSRRRRKSSAFSHDNLCVRRRDRMRRRRRNKRNVPRTGLPFTVNGNNSSLLIMNTVSADLQTRVFDLLYVYP
jgi:hypothetical protein